VDQRAIAEHRQVEAAAVPGHELRRVLVDEIEEAPDELGLGVVRSADGCNLEAAVVAQRTGDRHHLSGTEAAEIGATL
jgi:hypothetical protein